VSALACGLLDQHLVQIRTVVFKGVSVNADFEICRQGGAGLSTRQVKIKMLAKEPAFWLSHQVSRLNSKSVLL
jgi:hypothetical protein